MADSSGTGVSSRASRRLATVLCILTFLINPEFTVSHDKKLVI